VSQGVGFWGGCSTCLVQLPNNVLQGTEGHGTIKFLGTFSTFSWTVPNPEVWHGFTFAIRTTGLLGNTSVNEGDTATNSGAWADPGVNDNVALSASVGTVTKNANGTWNWSLNTTDGPAQSQTVTITATDKDGAATSKTFPIVVKNVAPTASFSTSGPVDEGSSFTLMLSNGADASSVEPEACSTPSTVAAATVRWAPPPPPPAPPPTTAPAPSRARCRTRTAVSLSTPARCW